MRGEKENEVSNIRNARMEVGASCHLNRLVGVSLIMKVTIEQT